MPRTKYNKDVDFFMGKVAVALYLASSYLYYVDNYSLLSDNEYDNLCRHLLKHWKSIKHPHKKFIDKESLKAGTGYDIEFSKLPERTVQAAIWIKSNKEGQDYEARRTQNPKSSKSLKKSGIHKAGKGRRKPSKARSSQQQGFGLS